MTDRELLEWAAKAAGIYGVDPVGDDDLWSDGTRTYENDEGLAVTEPVGMHVLSGIWNPLTNDGDALRLAVILFIFTTHYDRFIDLMAKELRTGIGYLAATRHAIVHVAAEIGKEMK